MKVRTQQSEATSLKPYLEYFLSLSIKAFFTGNMEVNQYINIFLHRNITTMASMINEMLFPTVLHGFLARPMVKRHIPKQIFKGLEICQAKGINTVPTNETRLPNCNNTVWTMDNIKTKDIRLALIIENTISHDREYIREKFDFTEEDMQSVPQTHLHT